uniref:ENTH domain-containing protein n=1 Tax=Panagrolaimus sp. JU765 TaxID=591449 RepID=A0AC34RKD8_9BILA
MSISTIKRQVKNVAYNFSDAQVKVREATSNDPWGPTTALMSEIAEMTNNPMAFTEIMSMLWKRLNDHGKNWRHVYKSLVLLDYLIKCGNEKVAQQCRENIYSIETLKDFQHIEDNRDQGMNVREKAKQMVALLCDEERLKNERTRFQMTRKRFIANGSGISSSGQSRHSRRGDSSVVDSELEEARPSSIGEEEMQLQIALALSREECAKEEEMRRGDDIRLQIALEESKRNAGNGTAGNSDSFIDFGSPAKPAPSQSNTTQKSGLDSAIADLMELNLADTAPTTTNAPLLNDPWSSRPPPYQNDPWSVPVLPAPAKSTKNNVYPDLLGSPINVEPASNDPWSLPPAQSANNDPWGLSDKPQAPANNDPWASNFGTLEPQPANNDPWSIASNTPMLAQPFGENKANGARPTSKTPESFLGESSSLVNFDNLMGPSPSLPPRPGSSNPFVAPATSTNPFASTKSSGPSINELMMQRESGMAKGTNPFAPK